MTVYNTTSVCAATLLAPCPLSGGGGVCEFWELTGKPAQGFQYRAEERDVTVYNWAPPVCVLPVQSYLNAVVPNHGP